MAHAAPGNARRAFASADQLIIPVSPIHGVADAAELMLTNSIGQGYGDLVKSAIVLLHHLDTRQGGAREIAANMENGGFNRWSLPG